MLIFFTEYFIYSKQKHDGIRHSEIHRCTSPRHVPSPFPGRVQSPHMGTLDIIAYNSSTTTPIRTIFLTPIKNTILKILEKNTILNTIFLSFRKKKIRLKKNRSKSALFDEKVYKTK